MWINYGVRDMSDMTLGGKYKVGFKRMKADLGNPTMIFYPCDTNCESTSVNAYENAEMLLKGMTLDGKAPGFTLGNLKTRKVS